MQTYRKVLGAMLLALTLCVSSFAQQTEMQPTVLITNANIFDGESETLAAGISVLVEGNEIAKIAKSITAPVGATVIGAAGRTMAPGFIDAHAHIMLQMSVGEAATSDELYFGYVATQTANTYLTHGFTTIRDSSGNAFSLKKSMDRGIVRGPRIYPSGPMISQTSGSSDHRTDTKRSVRVADEPSTLMKYDMVQIADGRPEVLGALRENLRRGATQMKIAGDGGKGSCADSLDATEYTEDEIRAAVEAAVDWGTDIMADV